MSKLNRLFTVSALLGTTALGACGSIPQGMPNANGDLIAQRPGMNVISNPMASTTRDTGYVERLREVRYLIKNTANIVIADYVHAFDYTSVPAGTIPRPIGFCFSEVATGTPARDRSGNHNGVYLLNGVGTMPIPCAGDNPYSYARYTISPYGPPVYKNGGYVGAPPPGMN